MTDSSPKLNYPRRQTHYKVGFNVTPPIALGYVIPRQCSWMKRLQSLSCKNTKCIFLYIMRGVYWRLFYRNVVQRSPYFGYLSFCIENHVPLTTCIMFKIHPVSVKVENIWDFKQLELWFNQNNYQNWSSCVSYHFTREESDMEEERKEGGREKKRKSMPSWITEDDFHLGICLPGSP